MEKPDTVLHYEEMQAEGTTIYLDPIELDEIFHFYAECNQLDKVKEVLILALQLHPEDILVQQMDAEFALNTGDAALALQKLNQFFSPDHPYHCILKSAALAKLGKKAEALDMAEQALMDEDPKEFVAYDLGLGFMNAEEFATAVHYFQRSLRHHPDDVRSMSGLLFCKTQLGKASEMQDLVERILALDPFNYDAWFAKGNSLAEKEHFEEAIDAYDYAAAVAPNEPDVLVLKARCLDGLKRADEAIATLYDAAEKAEGEQRASIYAILGGLLDENGQHQEAIDAVWKSLETAEHDFIIIMRAAYTFQDINAQDEALAMYEAALELRPEEVGVLMPLAEIYSKKEDYQKACECYTKIVNLVPNAANFALLGGTLMSLNKFEPAYKMLKKANTFEELWQTYILMAACDVELHRYRKMEEDFRMAYALGPDDSQRLFASLCPDMVKQMEDNGFFKKLEVAREKAIRKREKELRILAEARQAAKSSTLKDAIEAAAKADDQLLDIEEQEDGPFDNENNINENDSTTNTPTK